MNEAIVLLSGGLDSATCLAIAQAEGFRAHAISFRYGQRHEEELRRADRIAKQAGVASHRVIDIDLGQLGGSALVDASIDVPKSDPGGAIGERIPVTYVPARNTVFLAYALALAETTGSGDVFIGVNALDYSGYPDCRGEFIAAFETMANLATKAAVEGCRRLTIHTPLIDWTKAEIIRRGMELGVDYAATLSCYDPLSQGDQVRPCGRCEACRLRAKGFAESGFSDPSV